MKKILRPRYYCDFCGRGNGNPGYMKKHESGCTKNPNRICRMCALMQEYTGIVQTPRASLLEIFESTGFKTMADAANGCPACILSILRQFNVPCEETGKLKVSGPDDGRNQWCYADAKKEFWKEYNDMAY